MYSPFERKLEDLQPGDLAVLKTVSEGWYVEYKSQFINARALGKAISAFANTYGGWLFVGVKEQDKSEPTAGSFPGVPVEDLDATVARLRQSASEHLNPAPHFETKLLRGPCRDIGLSAETAVVAIQIPQSHVAPHVHRDGRIYRRVADGSEPKPETDRFLLDQLWRRGEAIRDITRAWVARDPELSKAEEQVPYVRLLMCVDPWRLRSRRLEASFPEVRSIVTGKVGGTSIPFDTFYSAVDGFVARQVGNNDPGGYVLTWRIWKDLSCELVLPLPLYEAVDAQTIVEALDGYRHGQRLADISERAGYTAPRIADLNFVLGVLLGVVAKYRRLLRLIGPDSEFYFKVRVLNVARLLPFIDIGEVVDEYEKHGLPIAIDSDVTYPIGDDPESFRFMDEQVLEDVESVSDEEASSQMQALLIFAAVSHALGVGIVRETESGQYRNVGSSEWAGVGARAMEVQRRRNRRRDGE